MATRVRSYSKINLGLAIGPVRADGFHGLVTLYQTLALHDWVTVEVREPTSEKRDMGHAARGGPARNYGDSGLDEPESRMTPPGGRGVTRITLTTNDARVPVDGRNTAWKMVEKALERLGMATEVAIHIEKALPVQGGMGAGSANAAAALLALERELGVEVPGRMELAAEVGSDVPLFLVGGAVLGVGRGEVVEAMPDLPATWCVVAVPEVAVSTPQAFQEWDERQGTGVGDQRSGKTGPAPVGGSELFSDPCSLPPEGGLTSSVEPDRLEELSHAYASVFGVGPFEGSLKTEQAPDPSGIVGGFAGLDVFQQGDTRNDLAGNLLLALVRTGIENDFEQVVFPHYPLLREIKHELMGIPAGSSEERFALQDQPASGKAIYAALSGSGSALFGLYRTETDAWAAQQRVQATGCKAILTETLPRQEYWRRMFAE